MDFIEQIKQLSQKIETVKDTIRTEEATKTSIIMPFFAALGYDIFNPNEFMPEYVADVGIKKGEKVDYAILKEGEPMLLIEAKAIGKKLERHDSQLFRYFGTTKAKFAILTNGIVYRFYTDIDERNKMDKDPFLEIDLLRIKDNEILELKKFHKDCFCVEEILDTASSLKYERAFKELFKGHLQNPGDDFVKLFLKEVYSGAKTQPAIEKFRPILKKSLNDYITTLISEKILSALEENEESNKEAEIQEESPVTPTDDEMEAFFLVKTILRGQVDMEDIYCKKNDSYFVVLYKNNTRKWICRMIFTNTQKTLVLPDNNKQTVRYPLTVINDVLDYKNQLLEVAKRYQQPQPKENTDNETSSELQPNLDGVSDKQTVKSSKKQSSQAAEPATARTSQPSLTDATPPTTPEPYRVKIYPHPAKVKRALPNKYLHRG